MKELGNNIELHNEDHTFKVVFLEGVFYATSNLDGRILKFKLTKLPYELTEEERFEVLKYNLGVVSATEVVNIKDIFMHGKFIEKVL